MTERFLILSLFILKWQYENHYKKGPVSNERIMKSDENGNSDENWPLYQ